MLTLGIDPGSRVAGWAVVDETAGRLKALSFGVVKPPADFEFSLKLKFLYEQFAKIISEYRPSEVAVENVFFAKNAKSALLLGQARAASIMPSLIASLPLYEYSALQVKKAATGKGHASKEEVSAMVCRTLSLKEAPKPTDVTDALAVALCHIQSGPMIKSIKQTAGALR